PARRPGGWAAGGGRAGSRGSAGPAATSTTVWPRTAQPPYDRGSAGPAATRGSKERPNMQDTSGLGRAGPAIALSGVNLSLGRGAGRVRILKDIDLRIAPAEALGLVAPAGS